MLESNDPVFAQLHRTHLCLIHRFSIGRKTHGDAALCDVVRLPNGYGLCGETQASFGKRCRQSDSDKGAILATIHPCKNACLRLNQCF